MPETVTFETLRIIGDDDKPSWADDDRWAFVAPRPLAGDPASITSTRWAGEVVVRRDDPLLAYKVRNNHRLDARIAIWIPRSRLIAETRARLVAEYGADVVNELDEDEILSMAAPALATTITLPD